MLQASFVAPISKPVTKAWRSEWRARLRQQEGHVLAQHRPNCSGKFRVNWNFELGTRLVLHDADQVILKMLPPHAHDIAAALAGVKKQR